MCNFFASDQSKHNHYKGISLFRRVVACVCVWLSLDYRNSVLLLIWCEALSSGSNEKEKTFRKYLVNLTTTPKGNHYKYTEVVPYGELFFLPGVPIHIMGIILIRVLKDIVACKISVDGS